MSSAGVPADGCRRIVVRPGVVDVPAGRQDDLAVLDGRVGRSGIEADRAAKEHGQRLVLRHRNHVDGVIIPLGRVRGTGRRPGMDDPVVIARSAVAIDVDRDLDVEQPLAHRHRQDSRSRHRPPSRSPERRRLLDPRRDQRDVASGATSALIFALASISILPGVEAPAENVPPEARTSVGLSEVSNSPPTSKVAVAPTTIPPGL